MGMWDFFRRTISAAEVTAEADHNEFMFVGPLLNRLAEDVDSMSVGDLWMTQPHLRTVTTFIAEQIASVSVHVYRRMDDGGRERVRASDPDFGAATFASLMAKANDTELMQGFLESTILDFLLEDEFLWVVTPASGSKGPQMRRIMPRQVQKLHWADEWTLKAVSFANAQGRVVRVPADQVIRQHGYHPDSAKTGTSPVTALRETLKEQLESAAYRSQLWKNGPRLGGVITRPQNAQWDDGARRRFKASWRAQYSGRGSGAGGTPVLEDGMDFKPAHLKAQDEQVVDMTKLSLATVAQVYHVNPTMVGLLDNANYSNVREFRRSLFGDSLGPLIKRLEGVFNHFLAPAVGAPADVYAEFNVEEKLRGSFEEKAQVTSTAVGAPWMTRNEARAMNNLPAVEGGDDLVLPLNTAALGETEPAPDPVEEDE